MDDTVNGYLMSEKERQAAREFWEPWVLKGDRLIIQRPVSPEQWQKAAEACQSLESVSIVVGYRDTPETWDWNFIQRFPHLSGFMLHCYEAPDLGFINELPDTITELVLCETRSKRHTIAGISRFRDLRLLRVEGHSKGIEAIGELKQLHHLVLRSVTLPNLEFLGGLDNLFALAIQLGGTVNLSALPALIGLKVLQLQLIRGLADVSAAAENEELEYLRLSFLRRVETLPAMSRARSLKSILMDGMKGITDLSPLLTARALAELIVTDAGHMQPDQFACLAGHPALRRAAIALSTIKKSEAAQAVLGVEEIPWPEVHHTPHFEYR